MVILPDPEQRAEIDRALGLDRTASDRFWADISQIVSDIEAHLQLERLRSEARNRVATINYVKKLSKQLSKIEALLADGDVNTASVLRRELGDILGLVISNAGFERFTGMSPSIGVGTLPSAGSFFPLMLNVPFGATFITGWNSNFTDPTSYHAQEAQMVSDRVFRAHLCAEQLMLGLIRYLNASLCNLLELERQNKGGSPGDVYRKHAIERLLQTYEQIEKKPPTPTGSFLTWCELVLTSIGLDTKGLEQALARILREKRKPA